MLLPAKRHTDAVKFHQKDDDVKELCWQIHQPNLCNTGQSIAQQGISSKEQSVDKVDQPSLISQGGKTGVRRLSHLCIAIAGTGQSWKWKLSLFNPA